MGRQLHELAMDTLRAKPTETAILEGGHQPPKVALGSSSGSVGGQGGLSACGQNSEKLLEEGCGPLVPIGPAGKLVVPLQLPDLQGVIVATGDGPLAVVAQSDAVHFGLASGQSPQALTGLHVPKPQGPVLAKPSGS